MAQISRAWICHGHLAHVPSSYPSSSNLVWPTQSEPANPVQCLGFHWHAGPCGPCTELYYDLQPERGLEDVDLEDDSRSAATPDVCSSSIRSWQQDGP